LGIDEVNATPVQSFVATRNIAVEGPGVALAQIVKVDQDSTLSIDILVLRSAFACGRGRISNSGCRSLRIERRRVHVSG
jgi:hypothetical protein